MMMTKAKMGPIDDEFIPQCDSNGQFHNVQCHEAIDACWCSDKNGNEIAGTRIKGMHHKPKCGIPIIILLIQDFKKKNQD